MPDRDEYIKITRTCRAVAQPFGLGQSRSDCSGRRPPAAKRRVYLIYAPPYRSEFLSGSDRLCCLMPSGSGCFPFLQVYKFYHILP